MTMEWDAEELAWARECAAAGDLPSEIAEAAGRPVEDVLRVLADLKPMSERQRRIASLYATGMTYAAVAKAAGLGGRRAASQAQGCIIKLRQNGYPIPKRDDRWCERRRDIAERREARP